ncbi:hypothetical protein PVNG_02395 [Plasmodium vivax North Korean]|uniref:Anticodon-binding domain-containing protein n=1 Tax=Plasmodium vivax North Korean TaxID=1035514 RepID=A0A0J9TND0_PLAVI|nr:hypothetical protein PVNG_02395 [Plasmodium vivax North Korean]
MKTINTYLEDSSFLPFKRYYDSLFRYKKHRLPPKLAKFDLTFAPLSSSYYEIFSCISDKEFLLKKVKDSIGKEIDIDTYSNFLEGMKSEDRIFRKNLYESHAEFVYEKRESLFKTLYFQFLAQNIESKNIRFKKGFVEASLYSDEIDRKFLLSFYKNISELKTLVTQFREIRKKVIVKSHNLDSFEDGEFYVYKYAVGMVTSLLFANKLMKEETRSEALQRYFEFLKLGDSKPNLECLETLSIDLRAPQNWEIVSSIFKSWVDEYKRLVDIVYGKWPKFKDVCEEVAERFMGNNYRVSIDKSGERISKKILRASQEGIPIQIIVGEQEAKN